MKMKETSLGIYEARNANIELIFISSMTKGIFREKVKIKFFQDEKYNGFNSLHFGILSVY